MNFRNFKHRIKTIEGNKAEQIRSRYIQRFVNTKSDKYQEQIAKKKQFSDGMYYEGYLWDSLESFAQVTEEQLYKKLEQMNREVYVLWDLHSAQRILVPDYWKFPRDIVLS